MEAQPRDVLAGVAIAGLDARARRQFGLARGFQGACVTRIDTSSAAFKAGLRAGDVIQQMNPSSAKIEQAASFPVPTLDQPAVLLRVWSGGGSRLLAVTERSTK
jgi:S1-C subfamily serine protease